MSVSHSVLSAVFSDESPAYRFPSEPNPGDTVTVRIRVEKDSARRVILLMESLTVGTLMVRVMSDEFFYGATAEHLTTFYRLRLSR